MRNAQPPSAFHAAFDAAAETKTPLKLVDFHATRYLDNDDAIAEYLAAVLEANDPDFLLLTLGDAECAKGMTQAASDGTQCLSSLPGADG